MLLEVRELALWCCVRVGGRDKNRLLGCFCCGDSMGGEETYCVQGKTGELEDKDVDKQKSRWFNLCYKAKTT